MPRAVGRPVHDRRRGAAAAVVPPPPAAPPPLVVRRQCDVAPPPVAAPPVDRWHSCARRSTSVADGRGRRRADAGRGSCATARRARRATLRTAGPCVGRGRRAVRPGRLDDDVAELLGSVQSAQRVDRKLKRLAGRGGRLAELPGRCIDILAADRVRHIDRASCCATPISADRARCGCCNRAGPDR